MSLSDTAGIESTHRKIELDAQWGSLLVDLIRSLDDRGESTLGPIFGQRDQSGLFSIYDAHALALLGTSLENNDIICLSIPLVGSPGENHDNRRNRLLMKHLPRPFKGTFFGNAADADGVIEWNERLVLPSGEDIPPGTVPLEVGTTSYWTTWGHCAFHGGVARIPYGASSMTLLVRIKPLHSFI